MKTMFTNYVFCSENIKLEKYHKYIKEKDDEDEDTIEKPPITDETIKNEKFDLFHGEYRKLNIKITPSLLQSYLISYIDDVDGAINVDNIKIFIINIK